MSKPFPLKSVLWRGAILGGIVSATAAAKSMLFTGFRNWHRNHYILNGMDGREGLITFAGGHWFSEAPLVGVFHDIHSDRFSLRDEAEWDLERLFRGCSPYQRSLADQVALRHLRLDCQGKLYHRVTAAFWDEGEYLAAADPWDELLVNGVDLINAELIEDRDAAFAEWQDAYQLSAEQVAFVRTLFERKLARPAATIELTPVEIKWLESLFEDPKAEYAKLAQLMIQAGEAIDLKYPESLDPREEAQKARKLCRELFAEIGIVIPQK